MNRLSAVRTAAAVAAIRAGLRTKLKHNWNLRLPQDKRSGYRMSSTAAASAVSLPATLPLVAPQWLAENLDNPRVKLVDASWYPPNLGPRDTIAEFQSERIGKIVNQNCVFFDIDAVADTETTSLPHMLPSETQFSEALAALGISKGDFVVIYDSAGLLSAPRAWWTFKALGVDDVGVLDGGLPEWKRLGLALDTSEPAKPEASSTPPEVKLRKDWVVNADEVLEMSNAKSGTILDARPAPRFVGEAEEPRPCLQKGHIPGSLNVPFLSVCQPKQTEIGVMGPLKDAKALREIFESVGVKDNTSVICSCGSGTTAAVLVMAMHVAGLDKSTIYDGSWAEWGNREDLPIEKST